MDLEEFRLQGHRLIDWIARYLGGLESLPVLPRVRPGEVRAQVPPAPPAAGEPLARILDDVDRVVVPGLTHWNHPGFLAYFANSSPAPVTTSGLTSTRLQSFLTNTRHRACMNFSAERTLAPLRPSLAASLRVWKLNSAVSG